MIKPEEGFSLAIRTTSAVMMSSIGGRPGRYQLVSVCRTGASGIRCRVRRALQHAAPASRSAAASTTSAITCPRPGSGQDPAPTCARRPHQRVRTRSLKPLIRRGGRVLEPHTQAHAILAVDFAHVDTDFLRRLYLLVVIEHSRRHVHIAGITAHSIGARVTQQARNLLMDLGDHAAQFRFLIRNRDSKFTAAFDAVFADADIGITRTPVRAPRANATAERWIGTLRRDASTAS